MGRVVLKARQGREKEIPFIAHSSARTALTEMNPYCFAGAGAWPCACPWVACSVAGAPGGLAPFGAAAVAACGCGGWAAGLIQQFWTRSLKASVSLEFGTKRVRQRNAAWICPPGQPNRS